jgi:CPA1 family monovalent cation:H+ antiporter
VEFGETLFLVLFSIATGVALAAQRLKIPYTVALVVTGLVLGAVHAVQPPHLTRTLLYSLILPGLLFEASYRLDVSDLRKNRIAIPMLAVPGVLATILVTAVILLFLSRGLDFLSGLTLAPCLVFGAVIAATDPIAVVGLFRRLGAPGRLQVLVEGESLLNDGTSLVLFGLVLDYVSGAHPTLGSLAVEFLKVVGTGVLTGVAIGTVLSRIIAAVDDPMIEITLTTIAAYGSFVAGEAIGGSGIIATVTTGILCGNETMRKAMSPTTRLAAETFWEYVAFALNSIVFLLIGFEIDPGGLLRSWQPILVAYLAVLVARALLIFAVSGTLRLTPERIPWRWTPVLSWSGLRGALSIVLVLSLPRAFPERSLLVTMTFGVVLLTILVQGTTMPWLLKRLGMTEEPEGRRDLEAARGRLITARAAASAIERMREDLGDAPGLEALRAEYEKKAIDARESIGKLRRETGALAEAHRRAARHQLLAVEKAALLDAARRGLIGRDARDRVAGEIDARLLELQEKPGSERVEIDAETGSPPSKEPGVEEPPG